MRLQADLTAILGHYESIERDQESRKELRDLDEWDESLKAYGRQLADNNDNDDNESDTTIKPESDKEKPPMSPLDIAAEIREVQETVDTDEFWRRESILVLDRDFVFPPRQPPQNDDEDDEPKKAVGLSGSRWAK